jgi:hypothetical protein
MNHEIAVAASIVQSVTLLLGIWFVLNRFRRKHSYIGLILTTWAGAFCWSIMNGVGFPFALSVCGVRNPFDYAPEAVTVRTCAYGGWIPGLELALLVFLFQRMRSCFGRVFGGKPQAALPAGNESTEPSHAANSAQTDGDIRAGHRRG